ncbi:MAG: amidohydrolase [Burkholderiales bacterium]|nr:amidohydrolase [Phycisphaerae bacterium]
MQKNDMIMISVDDHLVETPDLFRKHIASKFKDSAPRVVRFANGEERWLLEGKPLAAIAPAVVAGRNKDEFGMEPMRFDQVRKGTWDIDGRIDDMNANGVIASMNFANMPGFGGEAFIRGSDKALMLAVVEAYNNWHVDDWCAKHPGRMIPNAILPLWDVDLAVAEVNRMGKKGVTAVCFLENTVAFGLPSIHNGYWDPLFKAVVDNGMVVTIHIGTAGGPMFSPSLESPADVTNSLINIAVAIPVADFVFSPLFRKFPELTVVMSEGCIGWVPFLRERADAAYVNHRYWTHQDFGDQLPSDIIDKHFVFCFHDDKCGLEMRHKVGIDRITWESDYPHSDSTWPNSPEILWECVHDYPDDEINKITHLNAMRVLRFDPFKHIRKEDATVGALRAQAQRDGVDVTPKSMGGKKPTISGSVMTQGDVVKLFEAAPLGEPVATL